MHVVVVVIAAMFNVTINTPSITKTHHGTIFPVNHLSAAKPDIFAADKKTNTTHMPVIMQSLFLLSIICIISFLSIQYSASYLLSHMLSIKQICYALAAIQKN